MEKKQWGRRIRAFRKLKGMTQAELSRQINVSLSILGEIERGNREADVETIRRVSRALNVSVQEIADTELK